MNQNVHLPLRTDDCPSIGPFLHCRSPSGHSFARIVLNVQLTVRFQSSLRQPRSVMPDLHPVLLLFGLFGVSLFGSSTDEEEESNPSSDADEEVPADDSSASDSPFAPEADEPFDLDYEEPESPAENPFASEDEEPIDTDTVPHARPDGSSPFEDVSTSADDAPSAGDSVPESAADDPASPRPSEPPTAPPAADSPSEDTDEDDILSSELDVDESVLPSDLDLSEEGQSRSESSSSPQPPSADSSSDPESPTPEPSSQASTAKSTPAHDPPPQTPSPDNLPPRGTPTDDSSPQESTSPESATPPPSPPDQETLRSVSDARALSDTAMALFHNDQLDRAFAQLERHWRSSVDELDLLQQEIERMRTDVGEKYDEPIDYRFVRTDDAADALIRFSYLERFKHHGLRWKFTFYKGEPGWTLNDLSFDDDLDALLD